MNTISIISENETMENSINDILKGKFAEVAKELNVVLKTASKGERKGLKIFTPEASRHISNIADDFVKYVVRSIYDRYSDVKNGVLFRIHMNEIFSGDFVKSIFRQLNKTVDILEIEYEQLRESNLHNPELSNLHDIKRNKYDIIYRKNNPENVFNGNNEASKPFFDSYKTFKTKVKAEHPRVPDEKIGAYIRKTYDYSSQLDKMIKDFQNTFPEYVTLQNDIDQIYKNGWAKENELKEVIKKELETENYSVIKKCIEKLVSNFCNIVTTSIMQGAI